MSEEEVLTDSLEDDSEHKEAGMEQECGGVVFRAPFENDAHQCDKVVARKFARTSTQHPHILMMRVLRWNLLPGCVHAYR